MRIALFGKAVAQDTIQYVEKVIEKLLFNKVEVLVYQPFLESIGKMSEVGRKVSGFVNHQEIRGSVDYVISIGGDGTLLDASAMVRDSGIPIMGINIGRLGFLSTISKDEILPAIEMLLQGQLGLESRALLKLALPADLFGSYHCALNDLTITRKDSTSLMVIHVWIDDTFLNTYWADGIIVATPTGSTAYSLSSGGPILSPGSENFVITPIAPHNLTVRPFVISDKSRIRIIVESRDKHFMVSLDSRTAILQPKFELIVEKAGFPIKLVQMPDKSFYTTIREKLKWGLDIRN